MRMGQALVLSAIAEEPKAVFFHGWRRITRGLLSLALLLPFLPLELLAKEPACQRSGKLYHLTQYVIWPQVPDTVTVCVPDATIFNGELNAITQESTPQHPVDLLELTSEGAPSHCQIVYVPEKDADKQKARIATLRGLPVLSVGEGEEFVKQGGMIAFVQEGDAVRMDINLRAAERVGLKFDPQLLEIARRVIR
jgi:hypothetical protein